MRLLRRVRSPTSRRDAQPDSAGCGSGRVGMPTLEPVVCFITTGPRTQRRWDHLGARSEKALAILRQRGGVDGVDDQAIKL